MEILIFTLLGRLLKYPWLVYTLGKADHEESLFLRSMACVSESSDDRPNMSQVVNDLKECLATELAQRKEDGVTESSQIFTVNVTTETSPFAR